MEYPCFPFKLWTFLKVSERHLSKIRTCCLFPCGCRKDCICIIKVTLQMLFLTKEWLPDFRYCCSATWRQPFILEKSVIPTSYLGKLLFVWRTFKLHSCYKYLWVFLANSKINYHMLFFTCNPESKLKLLTVGFLFFFNFNFTECKWLNGKIFKADITMMWQCCERIHLPPPAHLVD